MAVWEQARTQFAGLPHGGGFNLAFEAVDRHVSRGAGDHVAYRFVGEDASVRSITYAELSTRSNRFANVLRSLGIKAGDTVFSFAGRIPEVYIAALGSLKAGAVFSALFANFGEEPVRIRLSKGRARILLTTATLYRRRIAGIRDSLPMLQVLVTGEDVPAGTLSYDRAMNEADDRFEIAPTDPEHPSFLHFTSGTTGLPKGALHVHGAAAAHFATARAVFGLREGDVYWCTADPGWVTGISYGLSAPLLHGVTAIVSEGEFDAARWYRIIQDHRVTVWYTAPTAIRMLMRAGAKLARSYDLSSLRLVASVGEPLSPEAIRWGRQALGRDIHDTWWQTETGAIMIATSAEDEVVLGTMGRPLPGIEAAVARRGADGSLELVEASDQVGELVLKAGWTSMFRGYVDEPERYAQCFAEGWYLTGDLACRDAEGRFSFVSRGDEVIKSAGHLIGPFEVESTLQEHPAVAEVGVIGKPDPVVGETVKAFVLLKDGFDADEDLRLQLLAFARKRLGPALAPREIAFARDLPRTRNGKIVRRLLRARELGLSDIRSSTLDKAEQRD
jgi:acetyl-CoA synthetase